MSNSTGDVDIYEMDSSENVVVFFRILIYVIGVIGNLLVIFVILFLKEYKKITHWYVLQMALADLIFLQNLPVKVTEDINGRWVNAEWLCAAQQTVLFFTYYASIMFLTIMAIDRYLAVCHPMSQTVRKIRSPQNAYIVSIVTWVIALGVSVPAMLYGRTSGTVPTCRCNLIFPQDPRDWCIRNGFETPTPLNMNTTLESCMQTIFPDVHDEPCFDPSAFNFGNSGGPPPIGGPGNSGDGQNPLASSDGSELQPPSTGGFDPSNPFAGLDEGDLQPSSPDSAGGFDPSNPFAGLDEGDLQPPSPDSAGGFDPSNPFAGLDEGDLQPPSADSAGGFDPSNPFAGIDENDLQTPSAGASSTSGNGRIFGACYYSPERPGFISYIYFNFIAMFVIPLLVLIFCYSLIIRRLAGSNLGGNSSNGQPRKGTIFKAKTSSTASSTTGRSEKEKTKVTILCFLLATLFTICWLPFHSVHLAKVQGIEASEESFCSKLSKATSLIAYFGSAINPYLYNFLGSFKKRINQIRNSSAIQSIFASGTTKASSAPRSSIPRSSIVPPTEGTLIANSTAAPEEIPLNDVATKL